MQISKLVIAALISTSLLGAMAPAEAADEINVVPGLSIVGAPLALHGFDAVAYFAEGQPRRGEPAERDAAAAPRAEPGQLEGADVLGGEAPRQRPEKCAKARSKGR